jgi:hypothetical protein
MLLLFRSCMSFNRVDSVYLTMTTGSKNMSDENTRSGIEGVGFTELQRKE